MVVAAGAVVEVVAELRAADEWVEPECADVVFVLPAGSVVEGVVVVGAELPLAAGGGRV